MNHEAHLRFWSLVLMVLLELGFTIIICQSLQAGQDLGFRVYSSGLREPNDYPLIEEYRVWGPRVADHS